MRGRKLRGGYFVNLQETSMKIRGSILAATLFAVSALSMVSPGARAQAKEQFIPVLSYRTGPYAPNGVPIANGIVDYYIVTNSV